MLDFWDVSVVPIFQRRAKAGKVLLLVSERAGTTVPCGPLHWHGRSAKSLAATDLDDEGMDWFGVLRKGSSFLGVEGDERWW